MREWGVVGAQSEHEKYDFDISHYTSTAYRSWFCRSWFCQALTGIGLRDTIYYTITYLSYTLSGYKKGLISDGYVVTRIEVPCTCLTAVIKRSSERAISPLGIISIERERANNTIQPPRLPKQKSISKHRVYFAWSSKLERRTTLYTLEPYLALFALSTNTS
jgi:hypothetical protein